MPGSVALPATESVERLGQLICAGVDVIRLNMAHGTGEWAVAMIQRIRTVSAERGRQVAVMMDIKGPEIRTGDLEVPIELKDGEIFDFTGRLRTGEDQLARTVRDTDLDLHRGPFH